MAGVSGFLRGEDERRLSDPNKRSIQKMKAEPLLLVVLLLPCLGKTIIILLRLYK